MWFLICFRLLSIEPVWCYVCVVFWWSVVHLMFDGLIPERVSKARRVLQDQLVSLGRRWAHRFRNQSYWLGGSSIFQVLALFVVQAKGHCCCSDWWWFGCRVIQEKLDRWGREDTRAPQDLLESKVYLEPLGRKVQRWENHRHQS